MNGCFDSGCRATQNSVNQVQKQVNCCFTLDNMKIYDWRVKNIRSLGRHRDWVQNSLIFLALNQLVVETKRYITAKMTADYTEELS